jgi:hypothetical protein
MKHRRDRTVVDYETRTGEGVAFYGYYPSGSALSFEWTGHPNDPIEVAQDAEVVATITTRAGGNQPIGIVLSDYVKNTPATNDWNPTMLGQVLTHWFAHICDEWVAFIKNGGTEPQWVNSHG